MTIFRSLLSRQEFQSKPPVLIDIGASEKMNPAWESIAQFSICLAFDADNRDLEYAKRESELYKKLYVFNRLVSTSEAEETDFYLTKFPYCSSSLKPNLDSLKNWSISQFFETDKIVRLKSMTISAALAQAGLDYIDWFKIDSQGTDLRIFQSLELPIIEKILMAEFEPGIINAYYGEDKLYTLMAYMDGLGFWLSKLNVQGAQRLNLELVNQRLSRIDQIFIKFDQHYAKSLICTSPCWGEATYLNTFQDITRYKLRDVMLGWIFATLENQCGFALELAIQGERIFADPVFEELLLHWRSKNSKSF
jgi:hypothetical protein